MFNELNLMVTLPKVVNKYSKLRGRIDYYNDEKDGMEDNDIKKLFEDINNLQEEIFNTKYDLILSTNNELYEAYDNIHNILMTESDNLAVAMEKRKLFDRSHVLDDAETEEFYKKQLVEAKKRSDDFKRNMEHKQASQVIHVE